MYLQALQGVANVTARPISREARYDRAR
jgi:hypothetical protein